MGAAAESSSGCCAWMRPHGRATAERAAAVGCHSAGSRSAAASSGRPRTAAPELARISVASGRIVRRFRPGRATPTGLAAGGEHPLGRERLSRPPRPRSGRILRRSTSPASRRERSGSRSATGVVARRPALRTGSSAARPGVNRRGRPTPATADQRHRGGRRAGLGVRSSPTAIVLGLDEDDLRVRRKPATGADPERISFAGRQALGREHAARTSPSLDLRSADAAGDHCSRPAAARRRAADGVCSGRPTLPDAAAAAADRRGRVEALLPRATVHSRTRPVSQLDRTSSSSTRRAPTCSRIPDTARRRGGAPAPEVAAAMPRSRAAAARTPSASDAASASHRRRTSRSRRRPSATRSSGRSRRSHAGVRPRRRTSRRHRRRSDRSSRPASATSPAIVARRHARRITLDEPSGDFLDAISLPYLCPVPRRHRRSARTRAAAASRRGAVLRRIDRAATAPCCSEPKLRRRRAPGGRRGSSTRATSDAAGGELSPIAARSTTCPTAATALVVSRDGAARPALTGRGARPRARDGQRYFLQTAPCLDCIVLNAPRPLFRDDPLAPRGQLRARPSPQLARGVPRRPGRPDRPAGRRWVPAAAPLSARAADLAHGPAARRRPARRAVLYYCTNGAFGGTKQARPIARIIQAKLARIGIAVSITTSNCVPRTVTTHTAARRPPPRDELARPSAIPPRFLDRRCANNRYGAALGPRTWNRPRLFRRRFERAHALSAATARRAVYVASVGASLCAPRPSPSTAVRSGRRSTSRRGSAARSSSRRRSLLDLGALCCLATPLTSGSSVQRETGAALARRQHARARCRGGRHHRPRGAGRAHGGPRRRRVAPARGDPDHDDRRRPRWRRAARRFGSASNGSASTPTTRWTASDASASSRLASRAAARRGSLAVPTSSQTRCPPQRRARRRARAPPSRARAAERHVDAGASRPSATVAREQGHVCRTALEQLRERPRQCSPANARPRRGARGRRRSRSRAGRRRARVRSS